MLERLEKLRVLLSDAKSIIETVFSARAQKSSVRIVKSSDVSRQRVIGGAQKRQPFRILLYGYIRVLAPAGFTYILFQIKSGLMYAVVKSGPTPWEQMLIAE